MAAPQPLDEDGARRLLEQCWGECTAQARRSGPYYVVSLVIGDGHAMTVEQQSPLGFADAFDALSIQVPPKLPLPWSGSSDTMTYDEERDFLRKLVAEEFSHDAVVDRKDAAENTVDESAHHVYLNGAPVYSIPEHHVRRHNEADIRRQLREARSRFDSLLGLPSA